MALQLHTTVASGGVHASRKDARCLRLGEAGPVALLFAVNAAAWALSAERMAGMDAGPGADLGDLGWFAVSWLVMMAAMTLPRGHADGRGVR